VSPFQSCSSVGICSRVSLLSLYWKFKVSDSFLGDFNIDDGPKKVSWFVSGENNISIQGLVIHYLSNLCLILSASRRPCLPLTRSPPSVVLLLIAACRSLPLSALCTLVCASRTYSDPSIMTSHIVKRAVQRFQLRVYLTCRTQLLILL
jgi:hypothetical protein